ncbi:dTDP-glucose 4,6-dehydratase [Pontibacter diazotrophicus]|uniref:dTDP-glucose 4,6-dehydratase n=1 Tax=Pontibacter diazotrophicus TaxID=1400979 RepID=A0A3D8LEK7_9BACT|nr:vitamin K epoxide reductase family protein [Pontibacter diazotrophicus]RDV15828.1 dTDP-glucose 4,6-dehydratase [Pontibacter diazotrophicus]
MNLTFSNLFFVKKDMFPDEKLKKHEEHHKKVSWVYYCIITLGFWLIANPPTFGYKVPEMVWNDILAGIILIVLSYFALKPYKLWAQWGIVFLGVWLFVAPMIFWAEVGAGFLNNYLIGTLVVVFGIVIPRQPGIKLFAQPGPNVPAGWSYNPSSWNQRVPVIFFAWVGFFVARYMGAFQLEYINTVWDPFFGDGTRKVLTSDVSESFPVSDATLGAFSYVIDVLFGLAGGTHRWRTMPWVVIIFGILIVPLGVVSITLVILQPVSVGHWCTLCLTSAMISLLMIPFTIDEVLATIQLMRHEKKERGTSYWKSLWFGGTMKGGDMEEKKNPETLLELTFSEAYNDLLLRPWNLFLIMLIGMWVMAAPGVLGYSGTIADSNHLAGAIIVTFAVIAMSEVARPLRYLHVLFGLWLIAAPWVLGTDNDTAMWNGVVSGIVIIALSFPKGKVEDKRGSFDKYIK